MLIISTTLVETAVKKLSNDKDRPPSLRKQATMNSKQSLNSIVSEKDSVY